MEKYNSGAKWESIVGYSRAVKAGNYIHISGTVAVDDEGNFHSRGDAYEQTKFIIEKIKKVLEHFGANLENVVRTRIYVTNIVYWEQIGNAHGEYFGDIQPATSMVEVSNLIDAECLVEIEADAYVK
jgi:enamine deaminase RidA (YjgF/YER057c/UK114 family)